MHPAIPCRWLRKLCSPQRRGGASELSLLETRLPAHCARLEQKRPACKEQGRLWNQQQWRCQVSSRPSCFPWERCICIAGHSRVRKRQVDSMGMEQQGVQHCEWDRRVAFQREHQRSIWASIPNATRKSHQVHPRERTTSFAHSWGGQENSDSRWPVPVRGKGPSLVRGHRKRWHDCIAPLVLNANWMLHCSLANGAAELGGEENGSPP